MPRSKVATSIRRLLDDEPLEDGRSHPAEAFLRPYLSGGGPALDAWCEGLLGGAVRCSERAALLRLLARVGLPHATDVRLRLVGQALTNAEPEVRDAAIQSAETWGDPALHTVLLAHVDQQDWLQGYAHRVAADLDR